MNLKQFIECGKIVSTHGLKGEVKVIPWANEPDYLLQFPTLYLKKGETPLEIISGRVHKNMVLLTLAGVETVEQANELRGQVLYLNREDDSSDAPFLQDFLGLDVSHVDTGKSYGKITQVLQTGANDVYILLDEEKVERLIPDIPTVVLETDFVAGTMKIRPLKGLFPDEN